MPLGPDTTTLRVYLPIDEDETIGTAACKAGQSKSQWARERLREAAAREIGSDTDRLLAELESARRALARLPLTRDAR